jgi:hypothetical protein
MKQRTWSDANATRAHCHGGSGQLHEEGKFEIGKDDVASLARNERMSVAAPEMRNMCEQNSCRA